MESRQRLSGNAGLVYHACAPCTVAPVFRRMDVVGELESDAKRGRLRSKTTPPASKLFSMSSSLDSGVGSFEETADANEDKSCTLSDGPATSSGELQAAARTNRFRFIYLGNSVVDRRYTQSMLPWVIAEVRRKKARRHIDLKVELMTVKAVNVATESIVFQHNVQTITRCARSTDLKCFAYLTKIPEDGFSCHCYVFEALDFGLVSGFLHSIRDAAKQVAEQIENSVGDLTRDVCSDTSLTSDEKQDTEGKTFPLWYVGRVGVSHRQAPPTLIDDCVELFKNIRGRSDLEKELKDQQLERNTGPSHGKHLAAKKANSLDDDKMCRETTSCKEGSLDSYKNESSLKVEREVGWRPRSASDGDRRTNVYSPSTTSNPTQSHLHVKSHARNASFSNVGENRNILFQISSQSVMCQSMATKAVLMEKKLREVSFCQQGTKAPEHFGFICYESKTGQYLCYVFKGESELLVDDVMRSLKRAFHSAWQSTGPTSVCDMCPLHHLHQLCVQLEGRTVYQQHDILQRHRINLSDDEMSDFTEKFQAESPSSGMSEENEVIMAILRGIYEKRQNSHTHNVQGQLLQKDKPSANLLQKAKKSLTSSFGGFLTKRGRAMTMQSDLIEEGSAERGDLTKSSPRLKRNRSIAFDSSSPSSSSIPSMSPIEEKPNSEPRQKVTTSTPEKLPSLGGPNTSDDAFGPSITPPSTPSKTPNLHRRLSRTGSYGYRQAIFHSVVTPSKKDSNTDPELGTPQSTSWAAMVGRKRTSHELRALWRKAIMEQILLIRMEKENKSLQVNQNAAESKLLKLDYKEIPKCSSEAAKRWDKILELEDQAVDKKLLLEAVKAGVPKMKRGEIWKFLAKQCDLRALPEEEQFWKHGTYEEMKEGSSNHQHSIFIDLGRTFPSHPYFSTQLGHGQLSLFNVLKAYSVLDEEVGYCQGLSFVAGMLLMHMGEKDAFDLLRFILFALKVRRQYKPDMQELQTQFYMLSRLLHDYYKPVSECLQELDITPTLYAAPWFLTLFASHFPVGFVARVMDMIFLQGMDVVFKVMLLLLGSCQEQLLCSDGLEGVVEVMKTSLPPFAEQNVEKLVNEVLNLDVSKDLESYEVEYCVLKEEDLSVTSFEEIESERVDILEAENAVMTKQVQDLTEQLSSARSTNRSLEVTISTMQINQTELLALIRSLRADNESLKKNFEKLKKQVLSNVNGASVEATLTTELARCEARLETSFTEENTDSFEHIGSSNELTDDETESLSRDSPANEFVDRNPASLPLNEKCEDLAVSR